MIMSFVFFFVNKLIVMISLGLLDYCHCIAIHTLLIRCVLELLPLLLILFIAWSLYHQYVLVPLMQFPQQLLSLNAHTAQLDFSCGYLRFLFILIVLLLHKGLNVKLGGVIVAGPKRVIFEAFVGAYPEAAGCARAFHFYNTVYITHERLRNNVEINARVFRTSRILS